MLRGRQWLSAELLPFYLAKVVKVACIQWVAELGLPWCLELSAVEPVEVEGGEPRVLLDINVTATQVSDTGGLASRQQLLDDILGVVSDLRRTRVLDHDNTLEKTDLICAVHVKWRLTNEHFIDQDTETPVINGLVVTLRHDDLGSEVFGCSAQGVCLVYNNLGKTEINHDTVSILVDQSILRLHVAINNVSGMKVSKSLEDACSVESRRGIVKTIPSIGVDNVKELSSLSKRQEKVQEIFVLEGTNKGQNEWMFEGGHDLLFSQNSLDLPGVDQLALCDCLQCVRLLCVAASGQPNLSECTWNREKKLKVQR